MHRNCTRDGLTSHVGIGTCFDVHSYLVCQDRVLLLSKCLFRRVHRACRCCSEDMLSSISPNKTTDSTTESLTVLVPAARSTLYPRPLCTPDLSSRELWGLAGRRAGHLYQLWATVATVSTLWPVSFTDKLQWGGQHTEPQAHPWGQPHLGKESEGERHTDLGLRGLAPRRVGGIHVLPLSCPASCFTFLVKLDA